MSVTVHPVDALISRLLQQYHRNSGGVVSEFRSAKDAEVNHGQVSTGGSDIKAGYRPDSDKLESCLLGLYKTRGNGR